MKFRRLEEELVTLCAQTKLTETTKVRIEAIIHEPLDWAYMLDFAQRHHITPLLFNNLLTYWKYAPPTIIMDTLKQWYHQHSLRNLMVTAELLKLQRLLKKQQIDILSVKGAVLAKQVYGDVRFRQFADLDVVIHMSTLKRATELLLQNGYSLTDNVNLDPESTYVQAHYNYAFAHKSGLFHLELHWRLWQSEFGLMFNLDDVWTTLHPVAFTEKEAVLTLSNPDLLLYLCAHGAKHQWSRLSWICDVNELLTSGVSLDWDRLIAQCKQQRIMRTVLLGVYLTHSLFGTPLPAELRSLIEADHEIERLAADTHKHLMKSEEENHDVGYYLRMREHWLDRVMYFIRLIERRLIPSERDTSLFKLPRHLFFLYYLIRPIRLAVQRVFKIESSSAAD